MAAAATTREEGPAAAPAAQEAWSLLRTLLARQRRRFQAAASELELHPAQAGALLTLEPERPLSMNELATQLACDSSNVTGIVDRLEARGLVTRRPHAHDRRVKHIVLTALGRRLRGRMLDRIGQPPAGLLRLPAADQRRLRDLLARALEEDEAAGDGAATVARLPR